MRRAPQRIARGLILAACVGVAVYVLLWASRDVNVHDMDAYWNAAVRLRHGQPLYLPATDIHHFDIYRYAPWFAVAWAPLTFLPQPIVAAAWLLFLTAAAVGVSVSVGRTGFFGLGLALLLGPFLLWTAFLGNIQPLLVASLYFGVERRSGPLWIALAGSLKAAPILLVLTYVGRREWRKAGATLALFGVLVAPMLVLPGYTTNPGLTFSLYGWAPVLYGVVLVAAAGNALILAKREAAWLWGAVAVIAALPRLLMYDLTFLMVSRPKARDEVAIHIAEGELRPISVLPGRRAPSLPQPSTGAPQRLVR